MASKCSIWYFVVCGILFKYFSLFKQTPSLDKRERSESHQTIIDIFLYNREYQLNIR